MAAPADPNSFEAIRPKLSEKTLQDIEGLDPTRFGFGREECCGAIPEKLPGSMKLAEHVFLGTTIPATQWGKRTENVPGYDDLAKKVKQELPHATLTVCEVPSGTDDVVLRFQADEKTGSVSTTQYSSCPPGELPWVTKGTITADRSSEYSIFVCAHRSRDERCGYCGAVLVDLFRQAVAQKMGEDGAKRVTVYPCSHVGGHIYAGNVIVYGRHGGVCFGLFKPEDVEAVVDAIAADTGAIPPSLTARIRGQMGGEAASSAAGAGANEASAPAEGAKHDKGGCAVM